MASDPREFGPSTSKALTLRQTIDLVGQFGFVLPKTARRRTPSLPAIPIKTETLGRTLSGLLPFYGLDCPIAICDADDAGRIVARGTLASLEGWIVPKSSLSLLVGYFD